MGWDDALDVWGVHGVGGFLGIVLLGVFGSTLWNPSGSNGLIYGGGSFFLKQLSAAIIASVWAFCFTYAFLWLINLVTRDQGRAGGRRARSGHRTPRRGSISAWESNVTVPTETAPSNEGVVSVSG